MKTPANVERFLDLLFINGAGETAERLVLTSKDGRNLGGWSRGPVRDLLMQHVVNTPKDKRPSS